jgi:hypothetical protein
MQTVIYKEKDGSYTINCEKGEVDMSIRNFGMVGKTYKTASEAFKDADYATAIQRPTEKRYEAFWGLLAVLFFVMTFGYIFYEAIKRF